MVEPAAACQPEVGIRVVLMVPFDVMSRTMMVAIANPFDALAKEAAQQLLDYNVQWHIAQPRAIMKVLAEAHRIAL